MRGLSPDLSRLLLVFLYFVVLNVAGTLGYIAIEGWSWNDSLYMTAITLTAVGYHEVYPLTQAGRNWTMGLLAGGLTGLGMWFALVTSVVIRMDIGNTYKRRKTMQRLRRLKDHIIVCGGGRMGRRVLHELDREKKSFVLIDQNRDAIRSLRRTWPDALMIQDDATDDQVLMDAGIERAAGLVSCLSDDADNLFVCLSARQLNKEFDIVGRAEDEATVAKMYRAGANYVVSPNVAGAMWVASVLSRPGVAATLLNAAEPDSHLLRYLEQASVGARSKLVGVTLAEARIPETTGLVVIALRKVDAEAGEITFNPGASARLHAGDDLIVLGTEKQARRLRAYLA